LQQRANRAGLPVKGRAGQIFPFDFSITQIAIDLLLGLPKRSPA
jgi:hypothetical protein